MSRRARFLHWMGHRFVRSPAGGWALGRDGQRQILRAAADVRMFRLWAARCRVEQLDVSAYGTLCESKHTVQGRYRANRLHCGRPSGHKGACCAPFVAEEGDGHEPTLRWWHTPPQGAPPPRCDEVHPVANHMRCRKALGHDGPHQDLQREGRKTVPVVWQALSEASDG